MPRLLLLLFFTQLLGQLKSQSIFSVLHLNEERDYKTKMPKKIVETKTFYNASGTQVEKSISLFDEAGMVWSSEAYDDEGNLIFRASFTNDTANRLKLSATFERWTKYGYSKGRTL